MLGDGGSKKLVSTDLLDFLTKYEAVTGPMSPVNKAAYDKALPEQYEYVEWTGDVIQFEDVSDLGGRAERYYIRVLNRATLRTPKNALVGFTAYFNDIDAEGQSKISLDHKITIRGKLWRWDKFAKVWFLKDSTVV